MKSSLKLAGFAVRPMYRIKRPRFLRIAKQKISFLIASLSLFAFVIGNMVGQHGWYAFYKTVLGKDDDATIVFVGTVPPIARVPDYTLWAAYGGNKKVGTFTQVPQDVLRDLPTYDVRAITSNQPSLAKQTYTTLWAGGYDGPDGSHAGVDIDAPRGTPVVAIANGVVERAVAGTTGFGNFVLVRHPNVPAPGTTTGKTTLWSTYAHMDSILVSEGQFVHKGQLLGSVGNTGLVFGATGYHLYFEVDTAEAPYHPYWPFTSSEIAQAHLSFVQAVNSTAYRSRVQQYTVNPMAFVDRYRSGAPAETQVAAAPTPVASEPVLSPVERLKQAAATRAASRKSRMPVAAAPVASTPASTEVTSIVTASTTEVASTPASGTNTEVDHVRIEHSGFLSRMWQRVRILAVDRNGATVLSPSFSGRIYVRADFGEAEIRPSELSSLDFVNGVATVNVLTRGVKTTIISTHGAFEAVSAPMVNAR